MIAAALIDDEPLATAIVAIVWLGVVAYAVFGGADFGSGVWDLFAGDARRGADVRKRVDRSIGPVWEANHVWLIFVLVFLWTGFPQPFAAMVTALFVPLIGAALGIVLRGAAFVYRKSSSTMAQARLFGVFFAVSSFVTPYFFGAAVGAVASGRVPADGDVDPWQVWLNPTSTLGGVLAVGASAWLAAVFLASDAARDGQPSLAAAFGKRALATGVLLGAVSLVGIVVLENDAPTLADGLERAGAPLVIVSAGGGLLAMAQIRRGRYGRARPPAAVAVVAILAGWAAGQYPWILVDEVEIGEGAGADATLWALLLTFGFACLLAVPALVWLLRLTNVGSLSTSATRPDSSQAILDRADKAD